MRISTNKKKIKKFLAFFVITTVIIGGFLILKNFIERPYKTLFKYCVQEESGIQSKQKCNVFLDNYYQDKKGYACLDIVLPEFNPNHRNVSLCFSDKVSIDWKNPYGDYLLNIPVIIEIEYSQIPIIRIHNIKMDLMSDEKARQIVDSINQKSDEIILFRSASATEEYEKKGYYLSSGLCNQSLSEKCINKLGVYRTNVKDYSLENGQLVLTLNMFILGREIEETVKVDKFQYEEYSYSSISKPLKVDIINSVSDLSNKINKNNFYVTEFFVDYYDEISDSIIDEYVLGNIGLDLTLTRVINYVE